MTPWYLEEMRSSQNFILNNYPQILPIFNFWNDHEEKLFQRNEDSVAKTSESPCYTRRKIGIFQTPV